jgi:hypothetical protein
MQLVFYKVTEVSVLNYSYESPPPPVAQQPLVGQGLLTVDASRSHSYEYWDNNVDRRRTASAKRVAGFNLLNFRRNT